MVQAYREGPFRGEPTWGVPLKRNARQVEICRETRALDARGLGQPIRSLAIDRVSRKTRDRAVAERRGAARPRGEADVGVRWYW